MKGLLRTELKGKQYVCVGVCQADGTGDRGGLQGQGVGGRGGPGRGTGRHICPCFTSCSVVSIVVH